MRINPISKTNFQGIWFKVGSENYKEIYRKEKYVYRPFSDEGEKALGVFHGGYDPGAD